MKIRKIAVVVLALLMGAFSVNAQYDDESTSTVSKVRKGSKNGRKNKNAGENDPVITQRMQSFYEYKEISDADLEYMRVIYRQLDLTKPKNGPLYFPEEPMENQESLFRIIMRLLANNQLEAYEYLDGREVFTEQYRINVKESLDRFGILYKEAKGSTSKNPKFTIHESDIPANEVLSYYIIEKWEFDRVTNSMHQRVEAICPVLHRTDDYGYDVVKYPMFWVKYDAIRPALSQQYIFVDDDNNQPKYSYDDFFNLAMYEGEIYKTRNLQNKSMAQLYPDPEARKRAQDSIDNRLRNYGKDLWVPSREELLANADKSKGEKTVENQKSEKEEVVSEKPAEEKSARSSRSRRGNNNSGSNKKPKVKQPKASSSSSNSNAQKSVRRRK